MNVILPYASTEDIKAAATFVAGLIENSSVLFSAEVKGRTMVITFNGGH